MRKSRRKFLTTGALGGIGATVLPAAPTSAASNGISALIQVAQLKALAAAEDALQGADKQKDLVSEQRNMREARQSLTLASQSLKEISGILAKVQAELVKAGCL